MTRHLIAGVLFLLALGVVIAILVADLSRSAASASGNPPPPHRLSVSMIQLIAHPNDYDGKPVRLCGFYRHAFEGTAIHLHRDDYEHGIYKNGFWVTGGDPKLDSRYVLIEGRFNAKRHGHMGLWIGEIENVTRMIPWPPTVETLQP